VTNKYIPNTPVWYALYVKYKFEKRVHNELDIKGIVNYLPLSRVIKKWSDRNRLVEQPLIPSYVFISPRKGQYYEALSINGVMNFVSFSGVPSPIPGWQIKAIQTVEASIDEFVISGNNFPPGEKVLMQSGPFYGMTGEVIDQFNNGKKLILRIPAIGYSVVVINRMKHKLTSIK